MLLMLLALQTQAADPAVVPGAGAPAVAVPRLDAAIQIDGVLDEPAWGRAVRLTGFHQFQPVDGRAAEEETEVLVWYAPNAIHFGIVARDRLPGTIRATVADRDNLGSDDRVTIYLDTFNDRRRAFFFTVNPLGAQEDGVRSEGGVVSAGNLSGGSVDRNPDFYFKSRGRLTDQGYEVEIRIPFKSLRFPARADQQWGLNVVRDVPRTGHQYTWTDVRRASASFLAQSATITGLHDLERGIVTEVQPFVTAMSEGVRDLGTGGFDRDGVDPSVGANLRIGLTSVSLDGTVNPDFSQVESDVSLVTVNERFALFFPEKRPFFLEGIELFGTPNQLIYTRQIEDPIAGGKITGKFGAWGVAHLTAVDEPLGGGDAVFNVTRVRRDLGANSLAGLTFTDRRQGGDHNTVLAGDARLVFARLYFVEAQIGGSWTGSDAGTLAAPLWKVEFDRTGRSWGFNYLLGGIGEEFQARAGFVPRNDIVSAHAFNRFTAYGGRGAALENFTVFFGPSRVWRHRDFGHTGAIEGGESANFNLTFRGGWSVRSELARNFFAFDEAAYVGYEVDRGAILEPFVPPARADDLFGAGIDLETPTFQLFDASAGVSYREVPIFAEAGAGRELRTTAVLALRPGDQIRLEARGTVSRITRARDGSEFAKTVIPRLQLEYQPLRALFFRFIGEYRSTRLEALTDPATGDPLVVAGVPAAAAEMGAAQLDWLASFEPTPGTVAFLGYGLTLGSDRALRLAGMDRVGDVLFLKLAYQFRR